MSRSVFLPSFDRTDPQANVLELCDLFQLRCEEDVPIEGYTIIYDGNEHVAVVGPAKYQVALFLMYLTTMTDGQLRFELNNYMRMHLVDYFGPELLGAAVAPSSPYPALHALLGHSVSIRIDPKPGYQSHLVSFRTYPEIIAWAWERAETITPTSPEPFLRYALDSFFQDIEAKTLEIKDEPSHWPTPEWADRALDLQNRLTPK